MHALGETPVDVDAAIARRSCRQVRGGPTRIADQAGGSLAGKLSCDASSIVSRVAGSDAARVSGDGGLGGSRSIGVLSCSDEIPSPRVGCRIVALPGDSWTRCRSATWFESAARVNSTPLPNDGALRHADRDGDAADPGFISRLVLVSRRTRLRGRRAGAHRDSDAADARRSRTAPRRARSPP
jgi:hypothetical protein